MTIRSNNRRLSLITRRGESFRISTCPLGIRPAKFWWYSTIIRYHSIKLVTSTVCGLLPASSCVVIMQMTLIRLPFTYLYRNMPNLALPEDVCKKSLKGLARGYSCMFASSQWGATLFRTFHHKIAHLRMMGWLKIARCIYTVV